MGLIRFYLALSVVFWHVRGAPFRLLNAQVAVTLFFIISGFYMALVINEKYAAAGGKWIKTFYLARFWRLYPPYIVMVLVTLAWGFPTGMPNPLIVRLPMSALDQILVAIPNIFLFGQDLHQFLVRVHAESAGPTTLLTLLDRVNPTALTDIMMAVGQAWSLASEATFYLIAPLVIRSIRKTLIVLVIALAIRFCLIEVLNQRSSIWGYFFFPGNVCMFFLGGVSYHLHKLVPRRDLHPAIGWTCAVLFLAWLIALSCYYGIAMTYEAPFSIDRPRFWALYCSFAALVPFVFEATKRSRLDREIGELSYPLYLVHGLVLGIIYYRWNGIQGLVPDVWAAVVFCLFATYIMRQFVELPIERWRNRELPVESSSSSTSLRPAVT